MNVGRTVYIGALLLVGVQFFLSGCYKKDLAEFKNIDTKHQQEFAFPLFDNTLTIKDSIPFTYSSTTLSDTIEIDLALDNFLSGTLYKDIDYVEFKVITENNFPVTGALQFYFADKKGVISDSLFSLSRTIIDAGNGNTITRSTTVLYMDKDKYQKIVNSSKVYIRYFFSIDSSKSYVPYTLKVYSGIKFGITKK